MFSENEKKSIVDAISEAELNTSGEIRVHIDKKCKIDPVEKAIQLFEKLGMQNTKLRNGVLIYVATSAKKLAIIGDQGINDLVPENFWNNIKEEMISNFKKGDFITGISKGIIESGHKLKEHFPFQSDDTDELSNEISFGDE